MGRLPLHDRIRLAVELWLTWRWHRVRYWRRDATWQAIHSYGCHGCDLRG